MVKQDKWAAEPTGTVATEAWGAEAEAGAETEGAARATAHFRGTGLWRTYLSPTIPVYPTLCSMLLLNDVCNTPPSNTRAMAH